MAIKDSKIKRLDEQKNGAPEPDLKDMLDALAGDFDQTRTNNKRIEALEEEVSELRAIAAQVQEGHVVSMGRCQITPIGLQLPDDLSRDEWEQIGDQLALLDGALQWMIGDWLAFGEDKQYGKIIELAEQLGKEAGTLYNWAWTSRELPQPVQRYEELSHTHHQVVISMVKDPQERQDWLQKAAYGEVIREDGTRKVWSVARLKREIKGDNAAAKKPQKSDKSAQIVAHSREIAKLYKADVSNLRPAQVKTYRKKIDTLRKMLDDLESKLG